MSDLRDAALELAWGLCPLFVFATKEQEDEWKDHSAQHILAALQSAHAAGDRTGYERGVREAALKAERLFNCGYVMGISEEDKIARDTGNQIAVSIRALLPAQPKEPT